MCVSAPPRPRAAFPFLSRRASTLLFSTPPTHCADALFTLLRPSGPSSSAFSLAAPDGRLVRVAPDGSVDARGGPGGGGGGATVFFALPAAPAGAGGAEGGAVHLATRASPDEAGCLFLSLGAAPALKVEAAPSRERAVLLRVAPARAPGRRAAAAAAAAAAPPPAATPAWPPAAPPLSPEEREAFRREGFLVVKGAAGPLAVAAALRHLNSIVGELALAPAGSAGSEEARAALLSSEHPAALGLVTRTHVGGVAAQLCPALAAPKRAQLAPRYPQKLPPGAAARAFSPEAAAAAAAAGGDPLAVLGEARSQGAASRWHVDGMGASGDAPPKLAAFSLLVCVALSDTPHEGAGQFTVFPGSHLELSALVAAQGEGALAPGAAARPPLAAPPRELRLAAGDAVFAHPLLAHRVGLNFSARIRAAVFFRCAHREHFKLRPALLAGEPWAELLSA
jgi:hypothetical protein